MVRVTTNHANDIRPVLTVWFPTGFLTYLLVYKILEYALIKFGYSQNIPVEICGGGDCSTVMMTAAEYHAGPPAIFAMLLVVAGWYYYDHKHSK